MKKAALLAVFFFLAATGADAMAENAITIQGDLNVTGKINNQTLVMVPIGAVIDWWRPQGSSTQVPQGFQICNGSTINDPDSPFDGQAIPDLRHFFVRGAMKLKHIGNTGGSDSIDFPANTGKIHKGSEPDGATDCYSVNDDNKGWQNNCDGSSDKRHIVVDSGGNDEGQHIHEIGGSASNLPPYVDLLKIIRIK